MRPRGRPRKLIVPRPPNSLNSRDGTCPHLTYEWYAFATGASDWGLGTCQDVCLFDNEKGNWRRDLPDRYYCCVGGD